jgi:hypothetical protein
MQTALGIITPVKLMASMQQDQRIKNIANSIGTFVTSLIDMMAVFATDYDAGDFCRGLIFGRDGAGMLYEIAQSFVDD